MHRFGIDIQFSSSTVEWDGAKMEMHAPGHWQKEQLQALATAVGKPDVAHKSHEGEDCCLQQILDAQHEKQDSPAAAHLQKHLTKEQRKGLEQMLMQ